MQLDFSELFLCSDVNYVTDDAPLSAILKYIGFTPDEDMVRLGRYISGSLIEAASYIDHYARPVLASWGIMGNRMDSVWLSPEHRRLLQVLQNLGVVRKSIDNDNLLYHFVSGYMISDSGIFCTLTLTAQTAYALKKYGRSEVLRLFLKRYLDRDQPWYGATYYSETQGGSDLGSNRTIAEETGGEWRLNGHDKYFASNAGIADGAIVTARARGARSDAKGLSVFFVPAKRNDGTSNYAVRRLKEKLGTISVPTGEVDMDDSEAFMLGEKEKGIYYAMEILTISRIDDALAAAGIARKALWEAYRYSCRRKAFGRKIIEHPLLRRDFIELESDLEASLMLSLVAAKHFSDSCRSEPPYDDDYHYARMLTHIAKNMASETGSFITRYAMEIVGGRGFLSEFPIEKFHRDELVTSIWEGSSNIQALDLLELLIKKKTHLQLYSRLEEMLEGWEDAGIRNALHEALNQTRSMVETMLNSPNPEFYGKDTLRALGEIAASFHLFDASKAESGRILGPLARVYIARHILKERKLSLDFLGYSQSLEWMEGGNRNFS